MHFQVTVVTLTWKSREKRNKTNQESFYRCANKGKISQFTLFPIQQLTGTSLFVRTSPSVSRVASSSVNLQCSITDGSKGFVTWIRFQQNSPKYWIAVVFKWFTSPEAIQLSDQIFFSRALLTSRVGLKHRWSQRKCGLTSKPIYYLQIFSCMGRESRQPLHTYTFSEFESYLTLKILLHTWLQGFHHLRYHHRYHLLPTALNYQLTDPRTWATKRLFEVWSSAWVWSWEELTFLTVTFRPLSTCLILSP